MNLLKIINYILSGITIALVIVIIYLLHLLDGDAVSIEKLQKDIYICQNAPTKITIVRDTVFVDREVEYIRPKPKPTPIISKDTNGQSLPPIEDKRCYNISSSFYAETFEKEGVKISWNALTECRNDSATLAFLDFSEITYPKEIIEKTVPVEKIVETPIPLKNKFVLYGGVTANSLKTFPGIELGIGMLHKQNWMVTMGALYLNEGMYGSLKVGITF